jgi:membrane fusion protein, multidrug efflux system
MEKNDMNTISRLSTIGILLLAASFTSCNKLSEKNIEEADSRAGNAVLIEKTYNVRAVTVGSGDFSSFIDLSGDVEASVSVDVFPDTSGKLVNLEVKPGNYVKENQILAQVDPSKPGMSYESSPVKAPISGTVTAVNIDPGTSIGPQTSILTIGQLSELLIITRVPERFLYMVEKGQTAIISTSSAPGELISAVVTEISPVVNPVSRTLELKLKISDQSRLKAGMFVGVRLFTSSRKNIITVPEKSIIHRNSESYVYRIKDGTVEKIIVSLGMESEGSFEIKEGINKGDRIVTDGVSLLIDGSKINIIDETSLIRALGENKS